MGEHADHRCRYFSAESPSPLIFFYLWVFLYSAYFFTTTEMAVQIAYVASPTGAAQGATARRGSPAWWLVGMGTLAVAAIVIRVMRERVELLIARLYDAARTDPLTRCPTGAAFASCSTRAGRAHAGATAT